MEENLNSFYFKQTIDGVEHDYRVTMNETDYDVERDGIHIARLQHNEVWQQIGGEPLPAEIVEMIGEKIEDYTD